MGKGERAELASLADALARRHAAGRSLEELSPIPGLGRAAHDVVVGMQRDGYGWDDALRVLIADGHTQAQAAAILRRMDYDSLGRG